MPIEYLTRSVPVADLMYWLPTLANDGWRTSVMPHATAGMYLVVAERESDGPALIRKRVLDECRYARTPEELRLGIEALLCESNAKVLARIDFDDQGRVTWATRGGDTDPPMALSEALRRSPDLLAQRFERADNVHPSMMLNASHIRRALATDKLSCERLREALGARASVSEEGSSFVVKPHGREWDRSAHIILDFNPLTKPPAWGPNANPDNVEPMFSALVAGVI